MYASDVSALTALDLVQRTPNASSSHGMMTRIKYSHRGIVNRDRLATCSDREINNRPAQAASGMALNTAGLLVRMPGSMGDRAAGALQWAGRPPAGSCRLRVRGGPGRGQGSSESQRERARARAHQASNVDVWFETGVWASRNLKAIDLTRKLDS